MGLYWKNNDPRVAGHCQASSPNRLILLWQKIFSRLEQALKGTKMQLRMKIRNVFVLWQYKTIGQCCLMYKTVTFYHIKNFVIMVLCMKILKTNSILDTNSWHGSLAFAFELWKLQCMHVSLKSNLILNVTISIRNPGMIITWLCFVKSSFYFWSMYLGVPNRPTC